MPDRRQFLTHCTSAAATVLLPAGVLASKNDAPRPSLQLFAELIGQSFRGIDEQNLTLNFILRDILRGPQASGLEQFTLVFEESYRISQQRSGGLFRMFHPDTGQMSMRLEPSMIGPRTYTANFSLLA
jgi:hypothetical protein